MAAKLQSKTVTPTAADLTVLPDDGFDGLSEVIVNGDSDLVAANIKSGVNIFGIAGTYAPKMKLLKTATKTSGTIDSSVTFTFTGTPLLIVQQSYSAGSFTGKYFIAGSVADSAIVFLDNTAVDGVTFASGRVTITLQSGTREMYGQVDIYGV